MLPNPKTRNPAGGRDFGKSKRIGGPVDYSCLAGKASSGINVRSPRLPDNWRERLPDPGGYYATHVAKLGKPNATGWAQGQCPFHDDHNASLSVNVSDARGGWRCFASCGGGDLVGFHIKHAGLSFADAVRDLIGGAR